MGIVCTTNKTIIEEPIESIINSKSIDTKTNRIHSEDLNPEQTTCSEDVTSHNNSEDKIIKDKPIRTRRQTYIDKTVLPVNNDNIVMLEELKKFINGLQNLSELTLQKDHWYIDTRQYACRPDKFENTIIRFIKIHFNKEANSKYFLKLSNFKNINSMKQHIEYSELFNLINEA
uniref:Uncharacterized protein n=1 Tax=viral metagenome TaxID=1070528 RepID=A0A6C0DBA1_9ZZZZ